jgi:uncharacterized repeat protein (TIGR03806 family)
MTANRIKKLVVFTIVLVTGYIQSCKKNELSVFPNAIVMPDKLSAFQIFKGKSSELIPSEPFAVYELATPLYSDYSEKQRLLKLPAGKTLLAVSEGLPQFPDSTVLVKTFFYYKDKRNPALGKNIIETRLLVKSEGQWNVGTYLWNEEQTEATLLTTGLNKPVSWLDEKDAQQVISYHIPSNAECNTCHQASNKIVPIGPKVRNLNRDIVRNNRQINQLQFLQEQGLLQPVDTASISKLPQWNSTRFTLEERARAYLDVNCAHCHSQTGFCPDARLFLDYELSLEETRIKKRRKSLVNRLEDGEMPKLGITVVHQEGVELVKAYVQSLPEE